MEILLIIPKYHLSNKRNYNYHFPLGLAYISAVMKKDYKVDCLNLNHFNGKTEDLVTKKLDSKKYDVVCSGHIGIGYAAIDKIIKSVKIHHSKPKTIIGGAIITSEPKLTFESLKPDFSVIGEGEITIVELLKCLEKNKSIEKVKGIIYWKDNKSVFTKQRKPIEDIDSLPLPDFEGLGFGKHLDNLSSDYSIDYPRIYPLLCSRGCPFQCTFCYHCLGFKYRTRSIDNIIEELRTNIWKYKINTILIHDDLFSVNKERLNEFCKKIKELINELPWRCIWTCQLTVQNVDSKMIKMLKDSGCYMVSFGFESYSPVVLKSMKKPITPEQINKTLKLVFEEKMPFLGNFIFGDRAETKETAKETLDYWKKNCKGQVKLYFIQPYPGSEIYNHCIDKGIIENKLDFIKNKMSHLNWFNMTENMSDKEALELKKEILKARRKYYNYISPRKIRKEKENRYNLKAKCPFCNKILDYKNCSIFNRFYYSVPIICKSCSMNFYIVSPLYKFTMNYYNELEFFRKNYILIKELMLKKKI